MDVFEQWMSTWIEKNTRDRKAWLQAKQGSCTCPACPSYTRCAGERQESFYCITGKSMLCITEDRGCTCNTCPVVPELGLKYQNFCRNGKESVQRYEHTQH